MAEDPLPDDIKTMSFEEAIGELEAIVKKLEEGKGKLDEAIDSYERGTLLRRHCEAKLAEAQARIDRIVPAADGSVKTAPFETS
ncbi:MAG TPA: exodeoxyribonuclease VII small subunit [Candidatus Sulfotelmatobacter sp.]|nr:exodeoxyribonuclease VII small subunit [Candidatus Sulfotelmatobacter sp.]